MGIEFYLVCVVWGSTSQGSISGSFNALKMQHCNKWWSWNGDQNHWNITFLRSPNDSEEETISNHLALLANTKVAPVGNNKIIWPHDSKGKFTVKSFCGEVCEGSSNLAFPANSI